MTSKVMVIDKENAGGLYTNKLNPTSGSITKTLISNSKCTQLSTPKNVCDRISHQTTQSGILSKQRKALGDVFNTTSTKHVIATPTAQKCISLIKTPSSNVSSALNGKKMVNHLKTCVKTENLSNMHEYPPVEHCNIYNDTFEDLFENGNSNSNFKLENGKETFHQFEQINNENEWHKNIKSIGKLLRKEKRKDLNNIVMEMEIPELEAPKHLDD